MRSAPLALLGVALALASCSPDTAQAPNTLTFRQLRTPEFIVNYTRGDSAGINELVAEMKASLVRVMADLNVDSMPVITVVLYPDVAALRSVNPNVDFWVTGFVRGASRIEMVSPNAPNQVFEMWQNTRADHMLAHVVTLRVNGNSANNPRWLWESIALYESNDRVDARTVEFFEPGEARSLNDLEGEIGSPIFEVGYYLGEYIVDTYGIAAFAALLEANANVLDVLDVTEEVFLQQFLDAVRLKYGLPG